MCDVASLSCSVSSAVLEQQSVVCAGEAVQLAGVGVDQAAGAQIHRLQRGTAAQQRQTLIRHLHAAWNTTTSGLVLEDSFLVTRYKLNSCSLQVKGAFLVYHVTVVRFAGDSTALKNNHGVFEWKHGGGQLYLPG